MKILLNKSNNWFDIDYQQFTKHVIGVEGWIVSTGKPNYLKYIYIGGCKNAENSDKKGMCGCVIVDNFVILQKN